MDFSTPPRVTNDHADQQAMIQNGDIAMMQQLMLEGPAVPIEPNGTTDVVPYRPRPGPYSAGSSDARRNHGQPERDMPWDVCLEHLRTYAMRTNMGIHVDMAERKIVNTVKRVADTRRHPRKRTTDRLGISRPCRGS